MREGSVGASAFAPSGLAVEIAKHLQIGVAVDFAAGVAALEHAFGALSGVGPRSDRSSAQTRPTISATPSNHQMPMKPIP